MNPFIDMVRFTPNEKVYYQRSVAPMALFCALIIGGTLLVKHFRSDWPFELLVAIALLPVLPMAWFMKVYVDFFRDCDEWEKLIEVYGICIGVLIVGMAYFALGLLGVMRLVVLDGAWLAYGMLPAVTFAYVIGKVIGRWRHG
jgi:hypothetical protein